MRRSRILGIVLAALLSVAATAPLAADALWSAHVSATITVVSAPAPDAPPSVMPGRSRATYVHGKGPFPRIARVVEGELMLDFGEVPQGNANTSPDVLVVANPGSQAYALSAVLSSDVAPLFERVEFSPAAVQPGDASHLAMKLRTRDVAPGIYTGTLTISDLFGTFVRAIPVRIAVVGTRSPMPESAHGSRDVAPPAAASPRAAETTSTPEPTSSVDATAGG